MSGVRYSVAAAELALAVYRQPALHTELLRGNAALPQGIAVLLRLAGGTEAQELNPALSGLAPEGELHKAAMFFVEEVLFQRDATHYRVLGLNPDATAEQIKEHHRLLMRLFHPDRSNHGGERREHFATRANLAYNTLRDAGSRASYDETLRPAATARMQPPHRAQVMPRRFVREPDSYWAVQVYPKLMRHLPQWVLAGTALASVTVVGMVYLYNSPTNLQQVQAETLAEAASPVAMPATTKAESPAANVPVGGDDTGVRFERRLADAQQVVGAAPAAAAEPAAQQPVSKPRAIAEADAPRPPPVRQLREKPALLPSVASARMAKVAAEPTGRVQKTAPAVTPESTATGQKPVLAEQPAPESLTAAAAPEVAPAGQPPADPPRSAPPDPNALLTKFLEAYERGDMKTCMALLDEGMRGKPELRREYDALFRGTDLRHIKILNINWSREGDLIRGEGQYRSTMMRKGETVLHSQAGQIRVELIRRGSTALINDLQYISGSRS